MNNKITFKLMTVIFAAVLLTAGCTLAGNNTIRPNGAENGGSTAKATVYFFYGEGCPHCTTQKVFLDEMKEKYPDLAIKSYETWNDRTNAELLQDMAGAYGVSVQGVPTTFIGDSEPIVGFAEFMKTDLEDKIKLCLEQGCTDPGSKL